MGGKGRASESSRKDLTAAKIARLDGAQWAARERSPSKAYCNHWNGLFCMERGIRYQMLFEQEIVDKTRR
jgi:hypothetical protein